MVESSRQAAEPVAALSEICQGKPVIGTPFCNLSCADNKKKTVLFLALRAAVQLYARLFFSKLIAGQNAGVIGIHDKVQIYHCEDILLCTLIARSAPWFRQRFTHA